MNLYFICNITSNNEYMSLFYKNFIWYEFAAYIAIDKIKMIFYNETTNC